MLIVKSAPHIINVDAIYIASCIEDNISIAVGLFPLIDAENRSIGLFHALRAGHTNIVCYILALCNRKDISQNLRNMIVDTRDKCLIANLDTYISVSYTHLTLPTTPYV